MGTKAYEQTMRQIESLKMSEAKIFSAVTNGLERHSSDGRKSDTLKSYLIKNQRLWVAVRNGLAAEDNAYPVELKGQLISLSLWVDRYTNQVLKGEAGVEDLIQVNKDIIAGLSGVAPRSSVDNSVASLGLGA